MVHEAVGGGGGACLRRSERWLHRFCNATHTNVGCFGQRLEYAVLERLQRAERAKNDSKVNTVHSPRPTMGHFTSLHLRCIFGFGIILLPPQGRQPGTS